MMVRIEAALEVRAKDNMPEKEITLYTPKDLQNIFGCGRKRAYEIMHIAGFPSCGFGDRVYTPEVCLCRKRGVGKVDS